MDAGGGRVVAARLSELRAAVQDYYGSLNEIKYGVRRKPLEKPEALSLYEQTIELGLPIVDGGIMEQPYIAMMEWRICRDEVTLFKLIDENLSKGQNNAT